MEREEKGLEREWGEQFCILPFLFAKKIQSMETAMNAVNHIDIFSRF